MDRIRSIGDFLKKKKEDKGFYLKVGIGVGVFVLALVIIIVVAAVVPNSGSDNSSTGTDGQETTTDVSSRSRVYQIPYQFVVNLVGRDVNAVLAIDDEAQIYVIQTDEIFKNVYVILNFKKRSQTFLSIRKTANPIRTKIDEGQVLFCYSSRFENEFTGLFVSSSEMQSNGATQSFRLGGRTFDIGVRSVGTPLVVSSLIGSVINQSCDAIQSDAFLKWGEKLSECTGNATEESGAACPAERCRQVQFKDEVLTPNQACKEFKKCNYVMGKCETFWAQSNYDGKPYCSCRQALETRVDDMNCPIPTDDADCEVQRRDIADFEPNNPCYCRYSVQRIHPFRPRRTGTATPDDVITWRVNSVTVPGLAKSSRECICE